MKKILITCLIIFTTAAITAQNVISIGSNYVTLNGTKVNEITWKPSSNPELGDAMKEITYYWDGEVKTFTQTIYYKGKGPSAWIYEYKKNAKLKPTITPVKDKMYKGGIAYAVYINCTQKICATLTYYDSFSNDATINNDAAITIMFATKTKATYFIESLKTDMFKKDYDRK